MKSAAGPDSGVRDALVSVLVIGALATVFAGVGFGVRSGLSVAFGVALAAGNLWALGRILGRVLRRALHASESEAGEGDGPSTSAAGWAVLAVLKMAVLFGGAWLFMTRGLVTPLGLVLGYGALPVGIAVSAVLGPAPRD